MALGVVSVNWLAVIIGAVVSFVFGWLWFGPLFGKAWLKGSGMSASQAKKMHSQGMGGKLITYFIGTLVMVYVLALMIAWTGASGFSEIAKLGFKIGIGFFAATSVLGSVIWEGRPWSFFFVNAVFWIIDLILVGVVLSAF